jgi:hypothetical protein
MPVKSATSTPLSIHLLAVAVYLCRAASLSMVGKQRALTIQGNILEDPETLSLKVSLWLK